MYEPVVTGAAALAFALAGVATLLFGVGVLLYERFAAASGRYFLVATAAAMWMLGSAGAWYDPDRADLWLRVAYGADALAGPALYWLVTLLTGVRRPVLTAVFWGVAFLLLAGGLGPGTLPGLVPGTAQGPLWMVLQGLLLALLLACVVASVWELVRAYGAAEVREDRQRHGLVLMALVVPSLGFLQLVVPGLGRAGSWFQPLLMVIGIIIMGVAAYRYRALAGVPAFVTREVVRTMSDAVLVLDGAGVTLSGNPAAEVLSGWSAGELRGRPISDLVLEPGDGNGGGVSAAEIMNGWRDREMLFRSAHGDPVEVSVSAEALREGPRVVGTVVVARDIRDRLRAERAMHASESRYRSLFWHNPGVGYEFAPDGTILSVNPGAERMMEMDASDLVGKKVWDILDTADVERSQEIFGSVLGGEPRAYELGLRTPSGRRVMRGVSIPVMEDGVVVSVFGVAMDTTEEDRAKRELEVQRQYFADLFESSPEAIVLVDPEGLVRRVNGEFTRMFGYSADEVLGERLDGLIVPVDLGGEAVALDEAARSGGMARAETVRRRKDGQPVEVSVLAREIRVPGEPPQMYGIYRDIADRLAAERKLREREEELRHTQRLEAVGKLAGGIAHDFNNLLTVINGQSRFILDGLDAADPLRPELEEIERAGVRAAGLTQQLLAFSRRQVLQPQVLDLNREVGELERMLRRLIGEDIELDMRLEADPATILADRGQVEQVIANLAVNARDAMPAGGSLRIRTDTARLEGTDPRIDSWEITAGEYVRLIVEDTGTGMAPDTLARAFDPFFTTKERGKGTGLGLATVFGIIKQSGGHITAETQLGRGTRFVSYLPVAGHPQEESAGAEEKPRPAEPPRVTVLVVEDEDAVRRLAARVLERRGYTVFSAADGHEALELASTMGDQIGLVLSDLVMPRMGGRELAERLRETHPAVPVIFMSGYDEELATMGGGTPGAAFIAKPFTPAGLADSVQDVLEGGG